MSERTTMNGKPVLVRPAKTVLNMDSKFREKLLCDGPTFSLGDACAYSCSFCYVPDMMRKASYVPHDQPHESVVIRRQDALGILYKQLTVENKRLGYHTPKYNNHLDNRVVYSSPLVDCAANMELVRETVLACKMILCLTHWHIRLLSKSNLLPKVAELLIKAASEGENDTNARFSRPFTEEDVKNRLIFGVSTGTLDDAQAAAFEQGCPKVSKRLESLHWLQDSGFRTFGMICPSLPQRENWQEWSAALMEAIRAPKCEHVWAEVINVRGESMTRTCKALHEAGYEWQAAELARVSADPEAWEAYARATFLAHACRTDLLDDQGRTKLRFLQYVTPKTLDWWSQHQTHGAILLGAAAHA
jgi:DNA repair photolyase